MMEEREKLKEILRQRALILKGDADITLASGQRSNFFFDMKTVLLSPESAKMIMAEILKKLRGIQFDYVGGMESGAIPIVTLVCANKAVSGRFAGGFYVRKKEKGHGERKSCVSNKIEGNLNRDSNVVIVDDVTTTGSSIIDAITEVEKVGCKVVKAITIVDRGQGAKENLAKIGVELDALFTAAEFGL
ncbi:MAG: orotate phosphoribosyltransferase [Halobacteriota archaeon]